MSEGQFDLRDTTIVCSSDRIEEVYILGEKFEKSFQISSSDGGSIRGVVYSTNPYVIPQDVQFDGVNNTIKYALKNCGFLPDDKLEGEFVVVANAATTKLPFSITFVRKKVKSSIGELTNLKDFVRLARENFVEANKIFHSELFEEIIVNEDINMKLLYRGYRRNVPSLNNLEEFLVSAGLKERITFSLNTNKAVFENVNENQKEELEIKKSNWGNLEIDVKSDADFVTVEKEHINSDYFLGSTLKFNYYVHKNHLHRGINKACISFETNNQHEEVIITATLLGDDVYLDYTYRDRKHRRLEFLINYEAYRLGRMVTGDWAARSIELIDSFIVDEKYDEENNIERTEKYEFDIQFYELMKAHAYIANKQRQEALWIIQNIKRDIHDKKSVKWAYLLYLCTLIEQEPTYVDKLTHEIEVIFHEHPEDVRIFWFLLFLREEYCNNQSRKLKAIYQWLNTGYNTPYLYVEAYALFRQDPYLITDLSDTTLHILDWARRHNGFTEDMCTQFVTLLSMYESYNETVFKIAEAMYQIAPTTELCQTIVNYLMKFNKYGKKYLKWYELCIYKEMRISGVYEAYLLSLGSEQLVSLPQILLMYFKYQSNISYDKKAIVYSNVVMHKKDYPSLYQQYLQTMELFAIEQMRQGHIDDALAVIYQDLLDNGIINDDIANHIAPLLLTARISVARKNIVRISIVEEQLENPIIVPVNDRVAYAPIYSKNYKIFLEDNMGNVYSSSEDYMCEFLLDGKKYFDNLKLLSPHAMPYVLRYFDELKNSSLERILSGRDDEALTIEDINCVETFISSQQISKEYKCQLYPLVIYFLQKHGREDMIERHLYEEVDYNKLDAKTLSYVISLFISNGTYDRAYYLITQYNGCFVEQKHIAKLVEYMIAEDFEEIDDDFFMSLAGGLIGKTKLTKEVCDFLNKGFVGPTETMIKLWHIARSYELKTTKLEDRILVQMFYSEEIFDEATKILISYMTGEYNRMLVEAVISYFANEYMLDKSKDLDIYCKSVIAKQYNRSDKQNDACKMALMKSLCLFKELQDDELQVLDSLVREYVVRNVYFSFYKKMNRDFIVKYHLYDKAFVEYHALPGEHIVIVYKKNNGEVVKEEMVEMYDGIYVKQFVIFFGDSIPYEVYKEEDNENVLTKDTLVYNDIVNECNSRYDLINKMQSSLVYYDEKELISEIKAYQGLDYVTKQIFSRI